MEWRLTGLKNASREAALRPLTASRENAIRQKVDKGQKTEGGTCVEDPHS